MKRYLLAGAVGAFVSHIVTYGIKVAHADYHWQVEMLYDLEQLGYAAWNRLADDEGKDVPIITPINCFIYQQRKAAERRHPAYKR